MVGAVGVGRRDREDPPTLRQFAIVTARELQLMRDEHERLRELGCTRRQLVMMGMVPTVLAAVGGGVLAVVAAIALSPLFPLGVARRADPDVGLHADWAVLAVGGVALVGLVVSVGFVEAYRSTSRRPWAIRRPPWAIGSPRP